MSTLTKLFMLLPFNIPMYAVVEIQWHQYLVQQWDQIVVDRVDASEWDQVTFDSVLLWFTQDWESVVHGNPSIAWANVTAKVLAHQQWDKLRVIKFQGKKRYTKTKWFRAKQTILSIEWVSVHV